ncbi:MAG: hypothetical protein V1686_00320 [Patescibacteria group bacterium]
MFKDLLEKLKKLNLPKGKFAIFGSGPMIVRGLKESGNIDLVVTRDVFEEFRDKEGWSAKLETCDGLQNGDIEMYYEWGPGEWDVEKLINEAEIIDGLSFARMEEVLRWKKVYNREKDQKDIELIEKYLENKK